MSAMANTHAVPLRSSPGKAAPAFDSKRVSPLRLVPQRRSSAARAPFVVVVVTILVGGLLGLLLLNTLVAQDSFALHDLATNAKALEQREQALAEQVQAIQAPAALAAKAESLGMVKGGPPAFLQLPSGRVLGQPMAGVAPAPPAASTTWTAPRPTTPPTTRGAAKPAAKSAAGPAARPASSPVAQPASTPGTHP